MERGSGGLRRVLDSGTRIRSGTFSSFPTRGGPAAAPARASLQGMSPGEGCRFQPVEFGEGLTAGEAAAREGAARRFGTGFPEAAGASCKASVRLICFSRLRRLIAPSCTVVGLSDGLLGCMKRALVKGC